MKMTKLLSMFTTVAVVATIGVSYAAWDSTTDSAALNVSIGNPATVKIGDGVSLSGVLAPTSALDGGAVTAELPVTTANIPDSKKDNTKLKLAVANLKVDGTEYTGSDLTVSLLKQDGTTAFPAEGDAVTNTQQNYKVKVTLADTETSKTLAGKNVTFDVTASAEYTPNP